MMKPEVNHIISSLQKRWQVSGIVVLALVSVAISAVAMAVALLFSNIALWWLFPVWSIAFSGLLVFYKRWRVTVNDVVAHLNATYPQLDASVNLFLKSEEERNFLEALQVKKVDSLLPAIEIKNPFLKKMGTASLFFIASLIVLLLVAYTKPIGHNNENVAVIKGTPAVKEKSLPAISAIDVLIEPPAYTNKKASSQQSWNVLAEEGSTIQWSVKTNLPIKEIQLVFDDSLVLNLSSFNNEHDEWRGSKKIFKPGFYQVKLNGQLSELYKIEVIKDLPPVITVKSPKPSITIDYGEPAKVEVNAAVVDDYGITQRYIMATVASGSGEAVKFKEQKIGLQSFNGEKTADIKQSISLPSLGMQPGDELYFYIAATDNNNQQSRSDIFIVTLADTAQLMSLDITINASDVKPEFFRSERQIIIETEQLLREKDTISESAFKNRSNELGIDQKLLRLRYGKFLGEESEGNIGEAHDEHDGHEHNKPEQFGNAAEILDQFSHKHDIAEDATFFDPETKKQLKATLAEMWNAELRLRTFKPAEALPYAYKALRLLKDLQQKSRVYVGKTNIKTPPLQKEKRLTGDLGSIGSPEMQRSKETMSNEADVFKQALSLLEQLKTDMVATPAELNLLERASAGLSRHASTNPAAFMHALQSMRSITNNLVNNKATNNADIVAAQKALYQIIPSASRQPAQAGKHPDFSLSGSYFSNLQKQQR